jgi:hypothetical protein
VQGVVTTSSLPPNVGALPDDAPSIVSTM